MYGGGLIDIVSSSELRHAGLITVAGQDASNGAGAGGGIFVRASKLTGTGDMNARGGAASSAGSGAGGRIAVLVDTRTQYAGTVEAAGGHGNSDVGGPGTYYLENNRLGNVERVLVVDNLNGAVHASTPETVIEQSGVQHFVFDGLDILGGARVEFVGSTLRVKELGGDKTGHLLVQQNQRLWIEGSVFVAEHDYTVEEGGELVVGQTAHVIGHSLDIAGQLTNADRLTVGSGGSAIFGTNMVKASLNQTSSTFDKPKYKRKDTPGTLTFDELELLSGSTFTAFDGDHLTLNVGVLSLRVGSSIHQHQLDISAGIFDLERGASVDADAVITQVQAGLCTSCGAGHASHGGVVGSGTKSDYFGTLYDPTTTGFKGEGGSGGNGGGHIHIKAIDLLADGVISANGGSGGTSSGGGSGGSVFLEIDDELRGTGTVRANGGAGRAGGSGGRVAAHVAAVPQFSGSMAALGGDGSSSSESALHGGPGTVFVESLTVDGRTHTLLTMDNANHGSEQVLEFGSHEVQHLAFDELQLYRTGIVRVHPSVTDLIVDVEQLTGDRTVTIHCFAQQMWVFEPHQRRVLPPVSLLIDEGGEMVFAPHLLYVGKIPLDWRGRITNVIELDMTAGTTANVFNTSQLAMRQVPSLHLTSAQEPGTFALEFVNLQAKSTLYFEPGMGMETNIRFMDIKFGATVDTDYVNATFELLDVEAESIFTVAGHRGFGNHTRGAGLTTSGTDGSGAGHGSPGGRVGALDGGAQYGDFRWPTLPGARGGNDGGFGGGWMDIVGDYVVVDGRLDASGSDRS